MTKAIEDVISEVQPYWSKDEIVRYLYINTAPFFRRDLNYFMASYEEKYRQYKEGFINRGFDIVCSTLSDYYVNLFNEFGIESKKVAANSAKIPLFVVLVNGDNSWYYLNPLGDLFNNQYGLTPTEYGIIPDYKTLKQYNYLQILPKDYIEEIDKKLNLPETYDSFFQKLHLEMTINQIFKYYDLERGDFNSLFERKIDFMNDHLLNIGQVNGPYERIHLYRFLERCIFFSNEKKFITIKLGSNGDNYFPIIEYNVPNTNTHFVYTEANEKGQYVLKRKE